MTFDCISCSINSKLFELCILIYMVRRVFKLYLLPLHHMSHTFILCLLWLLHSFRFMAAIKNILKSAVWNFYERPKQLTLVVIRPEISVKWTANNNGVAHVQLLL